MKNNDNNNNDSTSEDLRAKSELVWRDWDSSLKKGEILSIMFVGVGGQGIILGTTVVAHAAINAGFDVKVSEVHGMAQRGGSVVGSVRAGRKVFSPTVNKADFLIALEKLEGLRYLSVLNSTGYAIVNDHEIYPSTVFTKDKAYPDDIKARVKDATENSLFIEAAKIAGELKELRVSNIVLTGALSRFLPFEYDCWVSAIKGCIPQKAVKINIEAFDSGRDYF